MFEQVGGQSMFISAPKEILASLNLPKEKSFPQASYIWPYECERFHCFRLFSVNGKIRKAEAAFLCDNRFDLWMNGKQIVSSCSHMVLSDITETLQCGINNLHIRGYQTAVDGRFSSAISGGIRIYYENGEIEEIVTDGQFKKVQLVDFWETEEPDGFETEIKGRGVFDMNVMDLHPIALRRSFYFIRQFELQRIPKSARLYATALGCYEPYVNGKRASEFFFMPFGRNYKKEYQSFDILPLLKKGKNTVGMITGNGMYNCHSWGTLLSHIPEIMAGIELIYEDGKKEILSTDEQWLCAPSPLTDNDIQYGERYDANLERPDWCSPDGNTDGFVRVTARARRESEVLLEQNYPHIKKMREYPLSQYRILSNGIHLYDVGICIAGRARVRFRNLAKGQKIRIRFCERLNENGLPEMGCYTQVHYQQDSAPDGISPMFIRNMDVYTARGDAEESYECRFAYTGFRYVWVEGLRSPEELCELTAYELHNDLKETGEIFTAHELLNQIFQASRRSWYNNVFHGPTDGPTREKNYWNGDSQIFSHAACWITDNSKLLARWTENGIKLQEGAYGWEDETYEMPLTLYYFYGDKEILVRRYPEMLRLVEKRQEYEGMILPEIDRYCDWLSPKGISPSKQFHSGCWYYHMLIKIAEIAEIVGDMEKSRELLTKASVVKAEFNKRHLAAGGSDYDAQNQCGLVLPLAFGIAPEDCRTMLTETLVRYLEADDYHLSTGFIGTRFLFEVLADNGYPDIAYKVLTNKTFPSWAYMFATGATSITESWLGEKDSDRSLSMAHFALGSVVSWFFEYLGGIRITESDMNRKKIVLKPVMIKELGRFAVRYQSKLGEIDTEWHFDGDKPVFSYNVPEGVQVIVKE